jgi:hypothetical protein
MLPLTLLAAALLPLVVFAQDGFISGPTSSPDAAGYSCDVSKCQLPNCNCASTSPPGGLKPVSLQFACICTLTTSDTFFLQTDTPMFIVFTADDAIQSYTLDGVNQFLAQRKNPNGCTPKMTYYTSLNYTDYALVTGS